MSSHGLAVDLVNAFAVEFENGALGSIGGTGNLGGGNGRKQDLQIYCEDGSIDIDICTGLCTIYRRDQEPERVEPVVGERDYRRNAPAHNLIELLLGQRQNACSGVVGWQVVELLDAAYRSAQQGGIAIRPCIALLIYSTGLLGFLNTERTEDTEEHRDFLHQHACISHNLPRTAS